MEDQLQFAHKAGHSTETALLKVQHDIASALDDNCVVLLVTLDLSAAFDSVDQEQLMSLSEHEYSSLCNVAAGVITVDSLLLEIRLAQIERLQPIQNKAARLTTRTRRRDHITHVQAQMPAWIA